MIFLAKDRLLAWNAILSYARMTVTQLHDLSKKFSPINLFGPQMILWRDAL